ncbi:hypothetical protein K470DRAFT_297406 [Piedraia hortae CBS 480.64]|uniref:HIT-type domain-containing protein n=1 Tax=Piedraia hortae CBS 480.64 TaxID=1314780 RepID=A0A6A7CAA8_9PEZI|nr:hypothetical protein K470DRAFT_297406 [Piedraia hortae CBS 480.64]
MATGPLRFPTPHIEELPTLQTKATPGFAWVAVTGPPVNEVAQWAATDKKRGRASIAGPNEAQREALTVRQQKEVERKLRNLNDDRSHRDLPLPSKQKDKAAGSSGNAARIGRTPATKKILASGKTFAHYLDDEEAEIARTGRRDNEVDAGPQNKAPTRPSKTPIARRKKKEDWSRRASMASSASSQDPSVSSLVDGCEEADATGGAGAGEKVVEAHDEGHVGDADDCDAELAAAVPPLPTKAELEALLKAPSLSHTQARSAPPPSAAPPPRRFCETCGYWGRIRCKRCGTMTCSIMCKDHHDQFQCLRVYA